MPPKWGFREATSPLPQKGLTDKDFLDDESDGEELVEGFSSFSQMRNLMVKSWLK